MRIFFSKTSLKYLEKADKKIARNIIQSIHGLPLQGDIKKLKGWKIENLFRLRVGGLRVIFSMGNDEIKIIKIDTRGDVYK